MKYKNANMINDLLSKDPVWIVFLFLVSVAAMIMVPLVGIPDGGDVSQHLQFAFTYHDAIANGDLFPGWGANENHGFGSIGIRFYPPVAYYLLTFGRFLTGSWYDAAWINFIFWMFAGSVGIYFWAREWLTPAYSALAGALFTVVPYHLMQIYQVMLFAEFAGTSVLPFCFLFATRVCRDSKPRDILLLGVSFALLILTHIPTTLIGSVGLFAYCLLLIRKEDFLKTLARLGASVTISILLAGFHWIKLATEIGWLAHNSPKYTKGYYDFSVYLFPLYFNAGEKYIQRNLWLLDIAIIFTILMIVPVLISYFLSPKGGKQRKTFFALSGTSLLAIFLLSFLSKFAWTFIPTLQKIQFPWRWLSLLSIFAVVSFAAGLHFLLGHYGNFKVIIRYAALILVFLIVLFGVTQSIILSDPIERTTFESNIVKWQDDVGCQCWWTIWGKPAALDQRLKAAAEGREIEISKWGQESRNFIVGPGKPTDIRVATFFYPFWKARVNGTGVKVENGKNGEIIIPVGSDRSVVELTFEEPVKVRIAGITSLIS
ncbi:MAG: glycosyltransferase family 39 protein, partial [Acidobacteria bacterium]|nr:glycosyltransferase family 39 protein [Acidobacteriota bacterium]